MEQKQLTAQICAAYFGCDVQMELIETSIGLMVGVDTECIFVSYNPNRLPLVVSFSKAKLVLRRLEGLTDEEAYRVLEIEGKGARANRPEVAKNIVLSWHEFDSLCRQSVDYLRSIKIDIGYGDIPSLIDAGLAVEKKP